MSKLGWLVRSVLGGVAATVAVAWLDAAWIAEGAEGAGAFELWPALWGLALPVGAAIGAGVGLFELCSQPGAPQPVWQRLAALAQESPLHRSRHAARALLLPPALVLTVVALAHAARALLADGEPKAVGSALGLAAFAACAFGIVVWLAASSWLRRLLAWAFDKLPAALNPLWTGAVGALCALGLLLLGLQQGDVSGDGPPLGILAVLTRPELDLRGVALLALLAAAAWLVPMLVRGRTVLVAAVTAAFVLAPTVLLWRAAHHLEDSAAQAIVEHGTLGKLTLGVARKLTDRDKDGHSALFAGGDCNDGDPHISPSARDIPGNGIDEDCSGADLAPPPAKQHIAEIPAAARPKLAEDLNLLVLTVDTLRHDLGFAGNPRPISPRLDELAARSVVFERAYSMASYTGKSIPPLFLGKYPSECLRDGNHFTAFTNPDNVFLAERLKERGFQTFGGSSLWYIAPRFGMTQGIDTWDLSAKVPSSSDKDTAITSDKLTDVAIAQLSDAANTSGRFFAWYHYLDPHAQYMPHKDAPSFDGVGRERALYEGEVWFTDQQIGRLIDFVRSQPFGERTVIVVTSDHGEAFADHGMNWHGREIWESLVRVPWILHVPGVAARRVPNKRSHIDMVPTLLDVLGVPQPPEGELSGRSLMADLSQDKDFEERDVYIDMPVGPHNDLRRALITGPSPGKKLIHYGGRLYRLYDLASDPDEKTDLAKDAAELAPMVDALNQLRAGLKEIDVPPVKK